MAMSNEWPDLSQCDLQPTIAALHLWSQVIGKIRLSLTPWTNHSWHVPLYVSARGLTTGLIPAGPRAFEIAFDFLGDVLILRDTAGQEKHVALVPQSVATFYASTMRALGDMGIDRFVGKFFHEIAAPIPLQALREEWIEQGLERRKGHFAHPVE